MSQKSPIPPLNNPITDKLPSLTWAAYFTNLKAFIDLLYSLSNSPSPHNDLLDIQGGTTTERYHLTEAQHNNAASIPLFDGDATKFIAGDGTLAIPDHEKLGGLLGGTDGQHYHLTQNQWNNVKLIPTRSGDANTYLNGVGQYATPQHNSMVGLQGGAYGDYQHVTTPQLNKIANMESLVFGYITLGL